METLHDIPIFRSELFDFTYHKQSKSNDDGVPKSPEVILEEIKFREKQKKLSLTVILLWVLVQLITFLKNLFIYHVMGEQMNYGDQITKRAIPLFTGILFILFISGYTKRLVNAKVKLSRIPIIHFVGTCFVTTIVFTSSFYLIRMTGIHMFENSSVLRFFMMEVDRLFLIFLLASITTTAHHYFHEVRLKEIALLKMEKTYQQAEIISLNNQVNPHMISNTLNNIYTLISTDINEAKNMIIDFAHLLRQNLKNKDAIFTTIAHEKKFIKKYINLLQNNPKIKYQIIFNYADELNDAIVPKMVLQPLVENAVKHCGFREKEVLKIKINIEQIDHKLRITVKNPIRQQNTYFDQSAMGIGTENILKRLKVLYRNNFNFDLFENEKFFTCILDIPLSLDTAISPT